MTLPASPSERPAPSLPRLLVRIAAGLLALLVFSAALAHTFHSQLEAIGHAFVDRFGVPGMVIGTAISDGFHFLVPPQFYMLMGITSGVPALTTLAAVNLGSFIGGWFAYFLGGKLSHFKPLALRLKRPSELAHSAFQRYGDWALLVVSIMPITYAALCYLCGLTRLSKRGFFIITLIRIPRLVAYYYLVRLGWLAA